MATPRHETPTLDGNYIESHMNRIHTEESWARAIGEMVLGLAREQIGSADAEEVKVNAMFTITPVAIAGATLGSGCVRVCVQSGTHLPVCKHFPS